MENYYEIKKTLLTERELKGLQYLREANCFLEKISKFKIKNFIE